MIYAAAYIALGIVIGAVVALTAAGLYCVIIALCAVDDMADAETRSDQQEREAQIAAERAAIGIGGGADFHNFHHLGMNHDA